MTPYVDLEWEFVIFPSIAMAQTNNVHSIIWLLETSNVDQVRGIAMSQNFALETV
jgi:hypothetical protein